MAFMFKGPAALTGASTISTSGAATFSSGTVTVATADINGGNIDGTTIGGTSAAAGSFTTVNASGQITAGSFDLNAGPTVTSISTTSATTGSNNLILATEAFVLANTGGGGLPTIVDVTAGTGAIDLTAVTGNVVYMLSSGGGAISQNSMTNIGSIADGTIIRFVVKTYTNAISIGVSSGTPFKLVGGSVGSISFSTVGQGLEFVAASGELYLLGGGYGA